MKTLLLSAKNIAIQSGKSIIGIDELKEAFKNIEIIDAKASETIKNILPDAMTAQSNAIDADAIQKAAQAPKIDFSPEVKTFIEKLAIAGYTTDKLISKLYQGQIAPTDAFGKIRRIKEELSKEALGQMLAVESICDGLMRAEYQKKSDKPYGLFLFAGPISPAKIHVARTLGTLLGEYTINTFKMSTFGSENGFKQLFGTPNPYAGAGEGALTGYIDKNPKSILIIEDLELAGSESLIAFSKMMNEGKCEDAFNKKSIDCTQIILIFTTSMGKEVYAKHEFMQMAQNDQKQAEIMILDALSRESYVHSGSDARYSNTDTPLFNAQFMSALRQSTVVLFGKITFGVYVEFIKKAIVDEFENFEQAMGIKLNISDIGNLSKMLILASGPDFDLESIKIKAPTAVLDIITDAIIATNVVPKDLTIDIADDVIAFIAETIAMADDSKLLHSLFRKSVTMSYMHVYDETNSRLIFQQPDLLKIKRAKDFGEDGGFSIELPDVSFEDIAGHHKVKDRLQEAIRILKGKSLSKELGKYMPKGMLLYGPPGTGKTMLAKAFAREADLPFIATTGPDMLDPHMMKKVFDKARDYAPAIVFIDEIDVFKHRGRGYGTDMLINKLLTLIDGFSTSEDERIFIIAATNLKENIDEAIIRSGRIDLHVLVDYLDRDARAWFIDRMLKKTMFDSSINREKLLKYTANMSGADLQKIESESILFIRRKGLETVNEPIIMEMINGMKYGEKIEDSRLEVMLMRTAYHEAGHAVVSKILMPEQRIEQITVTPRADALGFVSYDQQEYQNHTRAWFQNRMCVCYAGRAAEVKQYGEEGIEAGASGDLKTASHLAYVAITELGMDELLQNITKSTWGERNEIFNNKIEMVLLEWITTLSAKTEHVVTEHWEKIETLAKRLIEKEIVEEDELNQIIKGN